MKRQGEVKVWFPAIRAGTGIDVFTERLSEGLRGLGVRTEVTWLPRRAEYLPWSVPVPSTPSGVSIVHVNTWLHRRFIPRKLPVVATMHLCVHDAALAPYKSGLQSWYHRRWIAGLEAAVLHRADRIVAVSRYTADRTQEAFGLRDIGVIHNGVDPGFFAPTARTEPHRPFRLLYIGSWSRRKGVDLLDPIMRRLGDDFELRYTGEEAGLPDNCIGLGHLDRAGVRTALQDADALIFPTRLEGFGLVAAEAMACGLPVVATRGSSLPEIVADGAVGFLCEQDDVDGFVQAIRTLSMSGCWRDFGARALADCRERFDERAMVDAYLDLYKDVLGRSAPGPGCARSL